MSRLLLTARKRVGTIRRSGQRRLKRAFIHRYARLVGGSVCFRIHKPHMGLFAHFSWILAALDWAERNGLRVHFRCTNAQYNPRGRSGDWLPAVLEQANPAAGPEFQISSYDEFPFGAADLRLGRGYARMLFRRHLRVPGDLVDSCSRRRASFFEGQFVIGLHYRGSDKYVEAPRQSHECVLGAARQAVGELARRGMDSVGVFIATDDPAFLDAAKRALPGVKAVEQMSRSCGTTAVHNLGIHDGTLLAREAMTDALLLAGTDLLIKTPSLLSGWAAILGREMPVLLLGRPHPTTDYYPDNMLASESFAAGQEEEAVAQAIARRRALAPQPLIEQAPP